jgi:hypothetical protein
MGSWEAVHKSEQYVKKIKPVWERLKIKDCGDYECENCLKWQHLIPYWLMRIVRAALAIGHRKHLEILTKA